MKKRNNIILLIILVILSICTTIVFVLDIKVKKDGQTNIIKWSDKETVNRPDLLAGMSPVIFEQGKEEPTILSGENVEEGIWYEYLVQEGTTENGGTSNWANAITEDGSLWVWIPRYAYKVEWDEKQGLIGKIDVVFLEGTSNCNKEGQDVTKLGYIVHPAFQNGKKTNYQNGEWDKEITGIWISKFEAGYAGQKYTASEDVPITNTNLVYERNFKNLLGDVKEKETHITYPVFMGKTYSYNNIDVGEMYDLSQALKEKGNPYGFDEKVDSHLLKNSEWGAVAYLAHSQYGRNGTKITINNMDISKAIYAAGAVTGYGGNTVVASANSIDKINSNLQDSYHEKSYAWYTEEGKLASTTGNLYGIYDMNGACSEYTAGYLETINEEKATQYAKTMTQNRNSTKYYTVYKAVHSGEEDIINKNYEAHQNIIGDAIIETSKMGHGYTSWFGETSLYLKEEDAFFLRSGAYDRVNYSGIFDFTNHSGHSFGSYGFHCALIKE